ncbi:DegT/DnrJ/EryC1/StrS family aminotransferase [Aphanothece microscopica]|uniref:DegT/DnrJ/EryC1/StrS family aminotransferase n=1 Tax=Aphanothece microscopica TaxID=1049561 RepID=UPI00398472E6
MKNYPIAAPDIGKLEARYVLEAVESGWISSIGKYVNAFEEGFSGFCGAAHGVSMTNGTDALRIALRAMGIGAGDEVVVPALSFIAVQAAVVDSGATPVLVDIDEAVWCLDPKLVAEAIGPKTKAIIAVHSYGHPADMDGLREAVGDREIHILEDAAESHGAKYKGKMVGSLADAACFSFYGNKLLTTGEGGIMLTDNAHLAERARFLRDHAMDKDRRYFHPEVGFNCRLTNVQAAIGCAQIERSEELIGGKNKLLDLYKRRFADFSFMKLNPAADWAEPVNWLTSAILEPQFADLRDPLCAALKEKGIDTRPFFVPAYEMPPYAHCNVIHHADSLEDTVSSRISKCGFNLPTLIGMTEDDVDYIAEAVSSSFEALNGAAVLSRGAA